jgi:RNA polymerase sigma factor (sigma-70 family)
MDWSPLNTLFAGTPPERRDQLFMQHVELALQEREESFVILTKYFLGISYSYVQAEDAFEKFCRAKLSWIVVGYRVEKGLFSGYFKRALSNFCVTYRRTNAPSPDQTPIDRVDSDPENNPERIIYLKELHDAVLQAIDHLDEPHRQIAMLRYIDEIPYSEISAITGFGLSYIKVSLFRSGPRIKNQLKEILGIRKDWLP